VRGLWGREGGRGPQFSTLQIWHLGKGREEEGDWVERVLGCSRVPGKVSILWMGVLKPRSLIGGVLHLCGSSPLGSLLGAD
jgi:hypothetical protein